MSSLSERLDAARREARQSEENPWAQLETPSAPVEATPDVDELQKMFNAPSAEVDAPTTPEITAEEESQDTDVIITATSRVGRFLQHVSDRIENSADRADVASERYNDVKEKAKETLRATGRSALTRLKNAGLITLGLGIMGAEKAGRGAKNVAEAANAQVNSARETVSDYRDARRQAAEQKAEAAATAKYERHANKMQNKREKATAKQERIDARLEAARQAKAAAEARKQARREKWTSRREAVKQYGRDVKEGFVETKDAAISGAKFAGNTIKTNAEFAGAATRELSREQKAKLGRLAARARAAGEGAVEGWKSV